VYSGPCAPAWRGNNGGATWRGVTADEIRYGMHPFGDNFNGRVPQNPPAHEDDEERTKRVLEVYFNQHYETYGRHVSFYDVSLGHEDNPEEAAATRAVDQYKVFGFGQDGNVKLCDALARRQVVSFCVYSAQASQYERDKPYLYSSAMDFDRTQEFTAEFICKKLHGKNADFAAGLQKGRPRRVSVLTQQAPDAPTARQFTDAYKSSCNGTTYAPAAVDGTNPASAAAAVARWQQDGVTTIVLAAEGPATLTVMAAADASNYKPEWITSGLFGLDANVTVGLLLPKTQTSQLFGIAQAPLAVPAPETECNRAYKSIDPDNDAAVAFCLGQWLELVSFFNGVQAAGPNLNPTTFQKALFSLGYRFGQTPWAIGGGFGPGDYSYIDDVGEIWFDPNATPPDSPTTGGFHWIDGGRRKQLGKLNGDTSQLFKTGVVQVPA
jgi:hypothetical protein